MGEGVCGEGELQISLFGGEEDFLDIDYDHSSGRPCGCP